MSTNYNQKFGLARDSPLGGAGVIGGQSVGLNKMSLTSTGGAGFNSNANYGPMPRTMRTISNDLPTGNAVGIAQGIRPPLYVPSKRDATGRGTNDS